MLKGEAAWLNIITSRCRERNVPIHRASCRERVYRPDSAFPRPEGVRRAPKAPLGPRMAQQDPHSATGRSEEHTSELQSRQYLVCRLLHDKKKNEPWKD